MIAAPRAIVVDTGVFAATLGAVPHHIVERYRQDLQGTRLLISFQTVAELRFGAIKGNWGVARRNTMERKISTAVHVPPHDDLTLEWAQMRDDCRRSGRALQDKRHAADLWIAATARLANVPLATHDTVFINTPGLTVICRA